MDMLVYPFTFYAVNGIFRLFRLRCRRGFRLGGIFLACSVLMLTVLSGFAFMTVRYENGGPFYSPYTIAYFPSTMLHNTVLLQDVDGTVKAFEWLNDHMDNRSVVLVQHALLGWALSYLDGKLHILYYVKDLKSALTLSSELGFNKVYLVWWGVNIGWYGLEVPDSFVPIHSFDRISIFKYTS